MTKPGRRIRAIAARSAGDTGRHMEIVWSGIVIALLVVAIAWILGLPVDKSALLTVVACILVPCVVFPVHFVKNWRHPDDSDEWLAETPRLLPAEQGTAMRVSIRSKVGAPYLQAHQCRITAPDGVTREASNSQPGNGSRFYFVYPNDFNTPAVLTSGRHEIAWFVSASDRGPREVLRHLEVVKLP